jgi:ATP-binding cassette, subfamily B, bacterial PglK
MILDTFSSLRGLYRLTTPAQKKGALFCMGVMLALGVLEILAASLIVILATRITSPGADQNLIGISIACLAVFVVKGGFILADSYIQTRWIQNLLLDLKERLVQRYTRMDYAHQVMRNSGQSLAVLYNDTDIYMRMGLSAVGIMLTETLIFCVMIGFLLYLQPQITFVLLVLFGGMGFFFVRYLFPVFKRWGKILQQAVEKTYRESLQIFQSYKDILIFGKTEYFIDRYMQQSEVRAQITTKSSVMQVIPRTSIEIIFVMFFVGLVIYFSLSDGDFVALTAVLSAYLYAGFRLLPGLNRILIQINTLKMSEASIQLVVDEMNSPLHESVYVETPDLAFNNSINVQNISYAYPHAGRTALADISFDISKGEFVGIVGATGSGKSTLLHLILGLLLPTEGKVLIDGKYPANSREWHTHIGYTAQNFDLMDGTIADNIAFGVLPEQRDEALIASVIKDAQLEQFVSKLPQGTETPIGEKGVMISGGERQRIALARALYRKPSILMLDEATSALDLQTEFSIMQAIKELRKKNLTILAITHRPETLKDADRILVIENGRITEERKDTRKIVNH